MKEFKDPPWNFNGWHTTADWIFHPNLDLSVYELNLLGIICQLSKKYTFEDGKKTIGIKWSWPSNKFLSQYCLCSERQVIRALNRLIKLKLVKTKTEELPKIGSQRYLKYTGGWTDSRGEVTDSHRGGDGQSHIYTSKDTTVNTSVLTGRKRPVEKLCGEKYYLKARRLPFDLQKVVDHWNDFGKPFSKPQKIKRIIKPLKIILNRQTFNTINAVIDIGYDYMSDGSFKFKRKGIPLTTFVNSCYPVSSADDEHFRSSLPNKHKLSWYNLFRLKSKDWLNENLLYEFNAKQKDQFYDLILSNVRTGLMGREKERQVLRGAKYMKQFCELNDYPPLTMKADFKNFLESKYPNRADFKTYWLGSKDFWNKQFADFLKYIGRSRKNQDNFKEI